MIRTARTTLRVVSLVATAGLAFTACGGDDEDSSATTAESETSAAAETMAAAESTTPETTAPPETTDAPETTAATTLVPETTAPVAPTTVAPTATTAVGSVAGFPFTGVKGDYTVVFPAAPTTQTSEAPDAAGAMRPFTFHQVQVGDVTFGVSEFELGATEPFDLNAARDGVVTSANGTLVSSTPVTLGGREGVEFTGSLTNGVAGTFVGRIYFRPGEVRQLLVIGPGTFDATDPAVAAFFASFQFTS